MEKNYELLHFLILKNFGMTEFFLITKMFNILKEIIL
jgi:hypothetical protein